MNHDEKRTESSEMTAIIPRDSLPPRSTRPATIEDLADIERARRDAQDEVDTLEACPAAGCADCVACNGSHYVECATCLAHTMPCPGTCSTCPTCLATHMLSREGFAAWRRENPEAP